MEFDIQTKIAYANGSDLRTVVATLQHFTSSYLYISKGKLYAVTNVTDVNLTGQLKGFANGCFELSCNGDTICCFRKELADHLQTSTKQINTKQITKQTSTSSDQEIAEKFSHNRPSKVLQTKQFDIKQLVKEGLVLPTIDKQKQKAEQEQLRLARKRERHQRKLKKEQNTKQNKKQNTKQNTKQNKEHNTKQNKPCKKVIKKPGNREFNGKYLLESILNKMGSPIKKTETAVKLPSIVCPVHQVNNECYNSDDDSDYQPSNHSDQSSDGNYSSDSSDSENCESQDTTIPLAALFSKPNKKQTKKTTGEITLASLMELGKEADVSEFSSFPQMVPDDNADDSPIDSPTNDTRKIIPSVDCSQHSTDDDEDDSEENDPMVQARQQAAQSICAAIRQKRNQTKDVQKNPTPKKTTPKKTTPKESDSDPDEEIPDQVIPRKFVEEVPLELIPENLQKIITDVFFDTYEETAIFHYEGGMFIMETWNGLTSVFDVDNVLNLPRLKPQNYHRSNDGTPKSLPFVQFKETRHNYEITHHSSKLLEKNPEDWMGMIRQDLTDYFREHNVFSRTTFHLDINRVYVVILQSVIDDRKFLSIKSKIPDVDYHSVD